MNEYVSSNTIFTWNATAYYNKLKITMSAKALQSTQLKQYKTSTPTATLIDPATNQLRNNNTPTDQHPITSKQAIRQYTNEVAMVKPRN